MERHSWVLEDGNTQVARVDAPTFTEAFSAFQALTLNLQDDPERFARDLMLGETRHWTPQGGKTDVWLSRRDMALTIRVDDAGAPREDRRSAIGKAWDANAPKPTCDEFLDDHAEGAPDCDDPRHTAAIARRRGGAKRWSPIVHGEDGGGPRDFLDDEPISCGSVLELQATREEHDDYGSFSVPTEQAITVSYETTRRGDQRVVVLYHSVGGHLLHMDLEAWMRFRRPSTRRSHR